MLLKAEGSLTGRTRTETHPRGGGGKKETPPPPSPSVTGMREVGGGEASGRCQLSEVREKKKWKKRRRTFSPTI